MNAIYSMDPTASWMRFTNYCTGYATCNRLHAVDNGYIDLLSFKIEDALSCIGDVPTPRPTLSPGNNSTINPSLSVVSPKAITSSVNSESIINYTCNSDHLNQLSNRQLHQQSYNLYVYISKSVLCMFANCIFSIIGTTNILTSAPTCNPSQTPSMNPRFLPSKNSTSYAGKYPTVTPTNNPSKTPTNNPTQLISCKYASNCRYQMNCIYMHTTEETNCFIATAKQPIDRLDEMRNEHNMLTNQSHDTKTEINEYENECEHNTSNKSQLLSQNMNHLEEINELKDIIANWDEQLETLNREHQQQIENINIAHQDEIWYIKYNKRWDHQSDCPFKPELIDLRRFYAGQTKLAMELSESKSENPYKVSKLEDENSELKSQVEEVMILLIFKKEEVNNLKKKNKKQAMEIIGMEQMINKFNNGMEHLQMTLQQSIAEYKTENIKLREQQMQYKLKVFESQEIIIQLQLEIERLQLEIEEPPMANVTIELKQYEMKCEEKDKIISRLQNETIESNPELDILYKKSIVDKEDTEMDHHLSLIREYISINSESIRHLQKEIGNIIDTKIENKLLELTNGNKIGNRSQSIQTESQPQLQIATNVTDIPITNKTEPIISKDTDKDNTSDKNDMIDIVYKMESDNKNNNETMYIYYYGMK